MLQLTEPNQIQPSESWAWSRDYCVFNLWCYYITNTVASDELIKWDHFLGQFPRKQTEIFMQMYWKVHSGAAPVGKQHLPLGREGSWGAGGCRSGSRAALGRGGSPAVPLLQRYSSPGLVGILQLACLLARICEVASHTAVCFSLSVKLSKKNLKGTVDSAWVPNNPRLQTCRIISLLSFYFHDFFSANILKVLLEKNSSSCYHLYEMCGNYRKFSIFFQCI